ncbi:hypothetical protein BDF14DRAFT_1868157 [Spinellus fusiger]|nr:hypothetical protein BDF14DRAFT_1868157 [Spinellus fusiger]
MSTAAISAPLPMFNPSNSMLMSATTKDTINIIVPLEEQKKKKKMIRQAVGVIVIDQKTQKILMLRNPKKNNSLRLPRGDCLAENEERPENAAMRLLLEKAGVDVGYMTCRIGTYTEANKRGKIIAHHWMYEVHDPTLVDSWPGSEKERVWVTVNEALAASQDRRIAHLALNNCSLHH